MTLMLVGLLFVVMVAAYYFLHPRPVAFIGFVAIAALPLAFGSIGGALITSTLVLCVLMAQPLYAVLGMLTLICFEFLSNIAPQNYGMFPEKIFELTDKNVLLAIPFFVIAGAIMAKGGIARALVDLAKALTHWLPGGLALSAIGGCVLFAAISGSSPVTVIAIGTMMYPALVQSGFGEKPAIGLLSSAGSLGIVIPPSIPMIIYAIVISGNQVIDVGDLFLAGIGPGLLIGLLLGAWVMGQALRQSNHRKEDLIRLGRGALWVVLPLLLGELMALVIGPWGRAVGGIALLGIAIFVARRALIDGFWALMLPLIILGGIYSGLFSPNQAAAVAVVYALVVAIYIHRELQWADIPELIAESTVMMGALIVIMVIAFVFNDYLVDEQIPDRLVAWIENRELSRAGFLITLNVFLLVIGCFMDIISAILIVAPLIAPIAASPAIGVDPIHLGIIFIVNLELGYLTPPLGINLFVSSTLFKKPMGFVIKAVAPYTLIMMIGILLITYFPVISLGPAHWLSGPKDQKPQVKSIEELMNMADEENMEQ